MPIQDGATNRLVNLGKSLDRVFEKAMDWADNNFQEEIEAVKWTWPNETVRSDGSRAGTTRDIIDTAGLKQSQRRENQGPNTVDFVWTGGNGKAYALEVHEGYTTKNNQRLPGRPFTDAAIFRLEDIVGALIAEELKDG